MACALPFVGMQTAGVSSPASAARLLVTVLPTAQSSMTILVSRKVAKKVGLSHTTVANARAELGAQNGQIAQNARSAHLFGEVRAALRKPGSPTICAAFRERYAWRTFPWSSGTTRTC